MENEIRMKIIEDMLEDYASEGYKSRRSELDKILSEEKYMEENGILDAFVFEEERGRQKSDCYFARYCNEG